MSCRYSTRVADGRGGLTLIEPGEKLLSQHLVIGSSRAVLIVVNNGLAEARGFSEASAAADHGFKHTFAEVLTDFLDDLLRELCTSVEHGHDYPNQVEPGIDAVILELAHDAVEHGNSFQSVVLALERNEDSIRSRERIQRQYAQGGWAVDKDDVKFLRIHEGLKGGIQPVQMIFSTGEFKISAAKIHLAGDNFEAFKSSRLNLVGEQSFAHQHAVGAGAFGFFQAQTAGRVGLGIEVEKQHAAAQSRDAGGEVNGSGGFAHTAFLVGDCDNFARHERRCNKLRRQIQVSSQFDWIFFAFSLIVGT